MRRLPVAAEAARCGPPMSDSPAASRTAAILSAPPEGVRVADERLILLTPAAGEKVSALIARDKAGDLLRVAITGGGCNGLSYKMKFVVEPKKGDLLVSTAGVVAVVDSKSALYLKGTHLDYSNKMIGGGFKFSNPNAKASCSCGESFSL